MELPGSTVIPEGIVDVNNVSLHCHSEMVKRSRFPVGKPSVTRRSVSRSVIGHRGPVMARAVFPRRSL